MGTKKDYSNFVPKKGNIAMITHAVHGEQLWSMQKVHSAKFCVCTGESLKNKYAYAPVTHEDNRGDRIAKDYVENPAVRRAKLLANI